MLPRIRHNNFIGAVELFVKSSHTKTHSNNFFNNIQHAFNKKDWISNYDSLLTLREFFRCATQIDKNSYQVLSSKNENVHAMDKFLISFSIIHIYNHEYNVQLTKIFILFLFQVHHF